MRLNPPAAGSYNDSQLGRMRTGSNSQYNHYQLDTIRQLPLKPMEYCRRWVSQQPGRNYRKVCINALAEVTGVSPQTIKDWGTNFHRRPKYITRLLVKIQRLGY